MFKLLKQTGEARLGLLKIGESFIETPSYVIVATDGHIRCLNPEDIPSTQTQMVISNTYHLWQSLGESGLNEFPGLHEFMGWSGFIMTDSGGFQVFSLGAGREEGRSKVLGKASRENSQKESSVRVTDSGVYFSQDGKEHYLDAELSMKIQEQLGADIVLAFDEPTSPHHDYAYNKKALARTHAWALRSLEAKTSPQKIYGIVQGGPFEDLRKESSKFIGSLPFDGFALGGSYGESYGSDKSKTLNEIDWSLAYLPKDKPRHLLGIGKIEDIFDAVEKGVDTMDCVIPTREARHGGIWTSYGRFDIIKGKHSEDETVLVEGCLCPVCGEKGITKSELREYFKNHDPEASRLATVHNVYFFNDLMRQIRENIKNETFAKFKKEYLRRKQVYKS